MLAGAAVGVIAGGAGLAVAGGVVALRVFWAWVAGPGCGPSRGARPVRGLVVCQLGGDGMVLLRAEHSGGVAFFVCMGPFLWALVAGRRGVRCVGGDVLGVDGMGGMDAWTAQGCCVVLGLGLVGAQDCADLAGTNKISFRSVTKNEALAVIPGIKILSGFGAFMTTV